MTINYTKGFTLIEVLVAIIIIAVGLLGLAGLQARALQAEFESYQRTQALILLEDMVNRINTNRLSAGCYETSAATTGGYLGTGITTITPCTTFGTIATQTLADIDLSAWNSLLKGEGETLAGANTGAMIDARGCVTYNSGTYSIAVAWQGTLATIAPTNACGIGLYSAENIRRVVTTTVRFANLS